MFGVGLGNIFCNVSGGSFVVQVMDALSYRPIGRRRGVMQLAHSTEHAAARVTGAASRVEESGTVDHEVRVSDTVTGFEDLYRGEYDKLVRTATFILGEQAAAEEVVQDGFVRVHQRWPSLPDPGGFLYTCVVNGCRDRLRRRSALKRHLTLVATDVARAEVRGPEMSDRVDLVRGLQQLPVRERTALVLRYYAGLSIDEIAHSMSTRPGTVKSLIHRGLARLRGVVAR